MSALGLDYWLQWQVFVCALIFIIPTTISLRLIINKRRKESEPIIINSTDLWIPCWRNLHPIWLLCFRASALVAMVFMVYQTVVNLGFFVFLFYTQWTFALVGIYFALGTFISARGCWLYTTNPLSQRGETDKFLRTAAEQNTSEQRLGLLENLMLIIYQISAGAVMLTDIVFWCLLLPFMTGENFKLTLLIGLMHSVNAIFLLLDSVLSNLQFTWFGITYFILWSCSYIVFQWSLHVCCLSWWPYPFLELNTPWAPLWYFGMALVHIPCYGLYALLIKAKDQIFSRLFPQAFLSGVEIAMEKKHT
ncbi:hypothetical protein KY290_029874 [Solanum tuberosum]|uniref:Transmembrane protein n=1 Tax=Solanum tuberosum TaxID=4113 RepID=A0ABQ7ULZ9_SOLTU|nr:hypothetical protein KY284_028911 [Solanum tuberosum]KAH0750642.1 hypothetical protein KY290_029874 [Solanum tuberosum]